MRIGSRSLALTCLLACVPASAPADDTTVLAGIRGGELAVFGMPARVVVPRLQATRHGWRQQTVRIPVTVRDARGTGAGWALALTASHWRLDERQARSLRASVWRVDVRCGRCTEPRARVVVPLALSDHAPVRVFAARRGTGMGRMRLTAWVLVTAPLATAPGPYVLRPTISRIAGP